MCSPLIEALGWLSSHCHCQCQVPASQPFDSKLLAQLPTLLLHSQSHVRPVACYIAAVGDDQAGAGSAVPAVSLSSNKPMPRIGLGTASFPLGDTGDRPVVREAVLRALDAGYRHFDTAVVYGTERAVGDAVAEAVRAGTIASRDQVYITSKLWIADAHPGHVLPALRKTLRNLQIEYVDMYLIHFPVSMRLPEAEGAAAPVLAKENLVAMDMKGVWEEMEECHRRGLAKAIGVSNFTCKKLEYLLSFANVPPTSRENVSTDGS